MGLIQKMKKRTKISTKEMARIAIFVAVTAILAQIAIPLPFSPVPISFGIIAVYAAALLLKPKSAMISQILYIMLGAIGLPVFGGFQGGVGILVGPTGGYLISYPLVAFLISYSLNSNRVEKLTLKNEMSLIKVQVIAFMSIVISHLLLYTLGAAWLSFILKLSFNEAMIIGIYPFAFLDLIKIVLSVITIVPMRQRLTRTGFLDMHFQKYSSEQNLN